MLVHEGWSRAFPWLVQGTTTRGPDGRFDLGLFSGGSGEDQVRANWRELAEGAAFPAVVHARQVHGSKIHVASREILGQGDARPESPPRDTVSPRPLLLDPADGHVTEVPGVLLGVTTADCVPVFLAESRPGSSREPSTHCTMPLGRRPRMYTSISVRRSAGSATRSDRRCSRHSGRRYPRRTNPSMSGPYWRFVPGRPGSLGSGSLFRATVRGAPTATSSLTERDTRSGRSASSESVRRTHRDGGSPTFARPPSGSV
jgi:hypothetical protein